MSAEDWFDSGLEKAVEGMWQAAIADYTKAIEIDQMFAISYYYRGLARASLKTKDYLGAIADYTKAIEISPRFARAYANRGVDRESLNDLEGACADWKKAANLGLSGQVVEWVKKQC